MNNKKMDDICASAFSKGKTAILRRCKDSVEIMKIIKDNFKWTSNDKKFIKSYRDATVEIVNYILYGDDENEK